MYLLASSDAVGRATDIQYVQIIAVINLDLVAVVASPTVKAVGNKSAAARICASRTGNVSAGTDLADDRVNTVTEL